MTLISCPVCNKPDVSNQARACPNCGHPINKQEYKTWFVKIDVNGSTSGHEELSRLLSEGWQIISEHEEQDWDGEGPFTRVVYSMTR